MFFSFRSYFVKLLIIIFLFSFLLTEFLSVFNLINKSNIIGCWFFFILFLVFIFFKKLDFIKVYFKNLIFKIYTIEIPYLIISISIIFFIILPLFFIAIYYPPNNSDSLGYHLPRVEHWIQNCNIDHYPSSDIRQLFHQPLSEYLLLNLKLLFGGDYFFNLVQFFSMIGSVTLISLIIKLFGFNYKFQILSILLGLSIPMGILQSTSTQTDYVAAFFLLSFIYFSLFLIIGENKKIYSLVFWSLLSLALGFLTKLTVAIFALPFCVWFLIEFVRKYKNKLLTNCVITTLIMLFINLPFYFRNFCLTGNLLGEPALTKMMRNEVMNIPYFISNFIRNISLHFAFPFANRLFNNFIEWIHLKFLGITAVEKSITLSPTGYEPFFTINEDFSGSFFLIFILFILIFYFLFNYKKLFYSKYKPLLFYFISLMSGFLLFCFIFKWQPWHARLHLPFFIVSIPLIAGFIYKISLLNHNNIFRKIFIYLIIFLNFYWIISWGLKNRLILSVLLSFIFLSIFFLRFFKFKDIYMGLLFFSLFNFSLPYVYFHSLRPLFGNNKLLFSKRNVKYFRGRLKTYFKWKSLIKILKKYEINDLSLKFDDSFEEYYLWALSKNKIDNLKINHIKIFPKYNEIKNFKKPLKYRALLSNLKNIKSCFDEKEIEFYKKFKKDDKFISLIIFNKKMSKVI